MPLAGCVEAHPNPAWRGRVSPGRLDRNAYTRPDKPDVNCPWQYEGVSQRLPDRRLHRMRTPLLAPGQRTFGAMAVKVRAKTTDLHARAKPFACGSYDE